MRKPPALHGQHGDDHDETEMVNKPKTLHVVLWYQKDNLATNSSHQILVIINWNFTNPSEHQMTIVNNPEPSYLLSFWTYFSVDAMSA